MQPIVLTPSPERALTDLDPRDVVRGLAEAGVVVFRGFEADGAAFREFSDRFSTVFTCDPHKVVATGWNGAPGVAGQIGRRASRAARKLWAGRAQADDAATARFAPFNGYGLNPHNENCYLPRAFPELVWFHCSKPADAGGATILADGREVLGRVDAATARFFRDEPIRYETSLQKPQWQVVWGLDDERELRQLLDAEAGVGFELASDGRLDLTFDSTQVFPRLFDGADVVRTNLLSLQPFGRVNPATTQRTTDGDEVPREVLTSLLDAVEQRTEVELAAGDVMLIDNTTVMHGRTPFTDRSRRIETRCAWLDDALVEQR